MAKELLILGGDNRQRLLCNILKEKGCAPVYINSQKHSNEEKKISDYSVIVFPVPVSKDKTNIFTDDKNFIFSLKEAVLNIKKETVVFGGGFPRSVKEYFESESILYHDMLESELFTLQNAYFTSQAAVRLLLENTDEYLNGKNVLVTGFGRISTSLCKYLHDLGMKVSVCARNDIQLKTAENLGYETVKLNEACGELEKYNCIFNTVPYKIFALDDIKKMSANVKYFELASAPFGADREVFEATGRTYIFGGSLPGKYLSYSSAELIAEYILKYI